MRNNLAQCQPLEPRVMLAGDVQVLIEAQILSVSGDDLDNSIGIDFDPLGPAYVVTGREGTTVNGSSDPVAVTGSFLNIDANLRGGRDQLTVTGLNLPAVNMAIAGGDGRDSILVDSSKFDIVAFNGGLGIDWFGLYASELQELVGTGGGDRDTLELRNIPVLGKLFWNDRSGPGGLFVENTQITGDFEFASADTTAPDGPFNVWMELRDSTIGGTMGIRTAAGDDSLRLLQVVINARIIDLDGGDNLIDE